MIGYAIFALLIAGAYGQAALCDCGAFVTTEIGQIMVYSLPPVDVGNCNQGPVCSNRCYDEFAAMSGGGDLNFITSDGVTTVGQLLCTNAGLPVSNQFVYSYYDICATNWQWTGDTSIQPLCCDLTSNYYECPTLTTIVM